MSKERQITGFWLATEKSRRERQRERDIMGVLCPVGAVTCLVGVNELKDGRL